MSKTADMDVLAEVLRLIESTLKVPADQVDVDASLESFGVNSLIVMELMENIEKEFDLNLTPAQFSNVETVRDLTGLVESLLVEKTPAPVATAAIATQPATAAAPAGLASAPGRGGEFQPVIDYVARKYAVDLAYRDYASVDQIVDTLLYSHTDALLRHYGIPVAGDGVSAHSASAPVRRPLVAIIGMSCRLPDAPDPRAFWANLLAGRNSIREIPKSRWDWETHYSETIAPGKTVSKWGALIDDVDCFDAGFFNIPAEEAASIDPQLRLLLEETYRAVEDAGIDMKSLAGSRTGVFVGYEYAEYERHLRQLNNQDVMKGPLFSSSSPSYYLSNRISHTFDLCGPSEAYNVNCASSAVAINRAFYSLINGESDLTVAGAASLNLFVDDYIAASQYGVLSPNGTSGVFDDDANGFTRGEGVATVVLKRLEDAERDNDRIYGVIRATHQNYRGAARNISEVKHESITSVLQACYEKAGLEPDAIDYVEVDGYASKWADSFEYEGVKGAFQKSTLGRKHVAMGSVKGNIGNVEPVSGVTNVIKLALSLHHKRFPATISKKKVSGFIDIANAAHPLYIADREIAFDEIRRDETTPIRAGVNSFADSGSNVHILLEEYMPKPRHDADTDNAKVKRLFVLAAKNAARLDQYVQDYIDFLSADEDESGFADQIHTAQVGREAHNERLAIVASSRKELLEKLTQVRKVGIKDKLGLDAKEIFHNRINPAEKSPLAALITPEMAQMQLAQSAQNAQWKQVALLWVNGVAVPFASLWQGRAMRRVTLPTYPFARERHWMDVQVEDDGKRFVAATPTVSAPVVPRPLPEATGAAAAEWHFYLPSDTAAARDQAGAMSAVDKIALFLKQEIGAQLGLAIDDVATDKDFLELGMNSMGVAEVIIKTDRLLATNLSPSVVFKNPEIGSFSEYLAETYADLLDAMVVSRTAPAPGDVREAAIADETPAIPATPAEILIPLQTKGDKAPIFAVPGAGGSALSLQQLSHALGAKQPFYCLEPAGLDGRPVSATSVEEIAEFNIEAMKSAQSAGPYRLLGYSNGGIVAFEMARRLLERGDKVASLTMLDSLSPALLAQAPMEEMTVEVFKHFVGSLGGTVEIDVERLKAMPEGERSGFLYDQVAGLGIDLPKKQFFATFDVATGSERQCREYRPAKLPQKIEVTVFRATAGFKDVPADYGWGEFLSNPVKTCDIDADHFNLLEKDPIELVARQLDQPSAKSAKKTSRDRAGVTA